MQLMGGSLGKNKQTKTLRQRTNVILANWILHGMTCADSLYVFKGVYKDTQDQNLMSPQCRKALDTYDDNIHKCLLSLLCVLALGYTIISLGPSDNYMKSVLLLHLTEETTDVQRLIWLSRAHTPNKAEPRCESGVPVLMWIPHCLTGSPVALQD